jgi:hypothetical protein
LSSIISITENNCFFDIYGLTTENGIGRAYNPILCKR